MAQRWLSVGRWQFAGDLQHSLLGWTGGKRLYVLFLSGFLLQLFVCDLAHRQCKTTLYVWQALPDNKP